MVITKTIAKKYFGSSRPLEKLLRCNGEDWQITGVVKDRPANSDIKSMPWYGMIFQMRSSGWMILTILRLFYFIQNLISGHSA